MMWRMTTDRVKRPATYEDLIAVPEHMVAEIVNGELVASPRPAPRHASTSSTLGIDLGGPFQRGRGGPGGWWILDEPELHLGPDVMVPDIAGWRRERMPNLPDEAYFPLAPDWVCEVLSDSTRRHDRIVKMPLYAKYGVSHLWLVEPKERTLETFVLENGRWALHGTHSDDDRIRAPPFDAIELELAPLWDTGTPPASPQEPGDPGGP